MIPLLIGLLVALVISSVLAMVERNDVASRKKYFLKMFCWCALGMIVAGVLMRLLPR